MVFKFPTYYCQQWPLNITGFFYIEEDELKRPKSIMLITRVVSICQGKLFLFSKDLFYGPGRQRCQTGCKGCPGPGGCF
jgi:hypothetical protein